MFIDIAFIGLAFYLSIPLVSGYFAHCYGRSFWLWFVLGTFFPVVAHVLLAFLCMPDRDKGKRFRQAYESLTRYEEEHMQQQIDVTLSASKDNSK